MTHDNFPKLGIREHILQVEFESELMLVSSTVGEEQGFESDSSDILHHLPTSLKHVYRVLGCHSHSLTGHK